MVSQEDTNKFLTDIEFKWVNEEEFITVNDNHYATTVPTLYFRKKYGESFRGWTEWQKVPEEN